MSRWDNYWGDSKTTTRGKSRWDNYWQDDDDDDKDDFSYSDTLFGGETEKKKEEPKGKKEEDRPGFFKRMGEAAKSLIPGQERTKEGRDYTVRYTPGEHVEHMASDPDKRSVLEIVKDLWQDFSAMGQDDVNRLNEQKREWTDIRSEGLTREISEEDVLKQRQADPVSYYMNRPFYSSDEKWVKQEQDISSLEVIERKLETFDDFYSGLDPVEKAIFINPYSQRVIDAHPIGSLIPGQQQYMSDEAFAEISVNAGNIRQHVQLEIEALEQEYAATGDKTLGKRLDQLRENEKTLGFIEQGLLENKGFFQGVLSGIDAWGEIVGTKEAWEVTEAFRKVEAGEELTNKDRLALEKLEGEEFQKVATRYGAGYQAGELLGGAGLFVAKVTLALKAAAGLGIPVTGAAVAKAAPALAKSKFLTGAASTVMKAGVVSSTVGLPNIATDYAEYLRGKYEYNWEEAEFDKVMEGDSRSKALLKAVGKDFGNNLIRFGLGPIITKAQNKLIGSVKQMFAGEAMAQAKMSASQGLWWKLPDPISEAPGVVIGKGGVPTDVIVGQKMDFFRETLREYGGLNGWLGEVVEQLAIKMWTEGVIEEKEFRGVSWEQVDDPNVEFNFTPQEIATIMASMAALQVIAELPDMIYPPDVELQKHIPVEGQKDAYIVEKVTVPRAEYFKILEQNIQFAELSGEIQVMRLTPEQAAQIDSMIQSMQKGQKATKKYKVNDFESNTSPPTEAQKNALAIIDRAQVAAQEDLIRKMKGQPGIEPIKTGKIEVAVEPTDPLSPKAVTKEAGLPTDQIVKTPEPKEEKEGKTTQFIKEKGLDPDSVNIIDQDNFIVENEANQEALLVDIPISAFGDPEFETLAQDEFIEGDRQITAPIEATLTEDGDLRITDGANRFSQAVANKDKTIPVVLINEDGSTPSPQTVQAIGELTETEDMARRDEAKPKLLDEQAAKLYDMPFDDLTPKRKVEALGELESLGENYFRTDDTRLLTELGRGTGLLSRKQLDHREDVFVFKGLEEGVYTDGMILFKEEAVAKEILNKFKDQIVNQEAKKLQKAENISLATAKSRVLKEKTEAAKDLNFPQYKSILPTDLNHELKEIGFIENEMFGGAVVLENDLGTLTQIAGTYYSAIKRRYPDSKFFTEKDSIMSPIAFTGGKDGIRDMRGVVMPMLLTQDHPGMKNLVGKEALERHQENVEKIEERQKHESKVEKAKEHTKDSVEREVETGFSEYIYDGKKLEEIPSHKKDVGTWKEITYRYTKGIENINTTLADGRSFELSADQVYNEALERIMDRPTTGLSWYEKTFGEKFEDRDITPIKEKMRKGLTEEEAAEADKIIEQELEKIEDDYDSLDDDDQYMYDMVQEVKTGPNTPEKAKKIKEAVKEVSPKSSPDYTYTPAEAAKRGRHIDLISPIDMVTMVEIANELSNKEIISILPKIGWKDHRGLFKGDVLDPQIQIKASLFADPMVAAKTMAHEIGHFVDYLPDRVMRGTFASKIASVKNLAKNFGEFKDATMRDEIYTLSKDYWRPYDEETSEQSYINYRKKASELYADFISMLFVEPSILNKQAPHTLEAFIAYLDAKPEVKTKFYEVWDDLTETGIPDLDARQKKVREMFDTGGNNTFGLASAQQAEKKAEVSTIAKKTLDATRGGVGELERLFVDVKQPLIQAERDYMNKMGIKLKVHERPSKAIEANQGLAGAEQAYITDYYEPINKRLIAHNMDFYDLGEWLLYNRIVTERGDITPQEAYDCLEGVTIADLFIGEVAQRPKGFLAKTIKKLEYDVELQELVEKSLKDGVGITKFTENLVKGIIETLFPEGVTDPEAKKFVRQFMTKDAAKLLSSILPMKKGIANPLGFTTESAQQQLDYMKEKLGEENFKLLEEIGREDFRAGTMAITEMKGALDYFGEKKLNIIRENKNYATFSVNHYLNAHISPRFREQKGTVKTVMNPAHATAIKNVQMFRAIEINEARKFAIDFLIDKQIPNAPVDPAPMKYDANLGYSVPDEEKIKRMKNKGLVIIMRQGKPEYHLVDEKMRQAIYEEIYEIPDSLGIIKLGFEGLSLLNQKFFRPIYVGKNFAFNIYNIQKDFSAYWESASHLTLPEAMDSYRKVNKEVWDSVMFRRDSEAILEMKRNKALVGISRADIYRPEEAKDFIPANIFDMWQTESSHKKFKDMTPKEKALATWDAAEKFMEYNELLPKVAGYVSMKEKDVQLTNPELADMVRNFFGSPNFANKGYLYVVTNNLILFSNATKEGLKRVTQLYTGSAPTGAKGAWVKIFRAGLLVVITTLTYLIRNQIGPFEGEEFDGLAKWLQKVPIRDQTHFTPIPFGMIGNKAVYFPLGRAEEDQVLNSIVWAMLEAIFASEDEEAKSSLIEAFRIVGGEIPTVHPLIDIGAKWYKVSQGENPYDAFRGRNVFSPYTFEYLPRDEKIKTMIEYTIDSLGFSVLQRRYDPRDYGEEPTIVERAHRIPVLGNPLYRIVRATNFGEIEAEWGDRALQDKTSRQEKTKTVNMMNADAADLIERNASMSEIHELLKVYQEAAVGFPEPKDGYSGDERRTATDIRKMFKKELYRESGVLPSWRVLDMHRNDQKANQLLRDKERLTQTEFENYVRNLRNAEVISDEFVKAFAEEGHISEKAYREIVSAPRERFHRFY